MKIRGISAYNKDTGLYIAMSLEFGLATQANTAKQASEKLDAQIQDYINEATGINKQHQALLLNRKAPFSLYLHYYWLTLKDFCQSNGNNHHFCKSINENNTHHA